MEHLTIALFFIVPMLITFGIGYIIGRMKSVDEWLKNDEY